jgi:serine phosphatase RsbU (regulator of sigma subunit)
MFERTRELAQTLQQSLLPREFPEIPGVRITGHYRAAAQGQDVGGDFYDVFTIGARHWGIAIGDVAGKGPEAAALTAFARYTLRALAELDPARVLEQLNDNALRHPPQIPEQLLTVLFAVAWVQEDALVAEVATAGHPAPLLRRATGAVEMVACRGPLIGLTNVPEYASEHVVLGPGDTLLLYTDGLTDARAPDKVLDEPELAGVVERAAGRRGQELAAYLEQTATQNQDPRDDIALLLIDRLPAGP